jgi:hypothetical protein
MEKERKRERARKEERGMVRKRRGGGEGQLCCMLNRLVESRTNLGS